MSHTPGPWRYDPSRPNWEVIISESPFRVITTEGLDMTEARDNALLVAAAPDLLEAAKRSLSWLTSYPGEGAIPVYEQMRKAIFKAEGRK